VFQLHVYELREMRTYAERRQAALAFHKEEYDQRHPFGPPPEDVHVFVDGEGEDEIDGYQATRYAANYHKATKTHI